MGVAAEILFLASLEAQIHLGGVLPLVTNVCESKWVITRVNVSKCRHQLRSCIADAYGFQFDFRLLYMYFCLEVCVYSSNQMMWKSTYSWFQSCQLSCMILLAIQTTACWFCQLGDPPATRKSDTRNFTCVQKLCGKWILKAHSEVRCKTKLFFWTPNLHSFLHDSKNTCNRTYQWLNTDH